jgi:hypothetical protein
MTKNELDCNKHDVPDNREIKRNAALPCHSLGSNRLRLGLGFDFIP